MKPIWWECKVISNLLEICYHKYVIIMDLSPPYIACYQFDLDDFRHEHKNSAIAAIRLKIAQCWVDRRPPSLPEIINSINASCCLSSFNKLSPFVYNLGMYGPLLPILHFKS
ncbi:hypothetical protein GDO78_004244 [Eleutherodactylus coqui]|uniref:Uncharacterized protein n=1 Tax=Eleutherodactylus coqui TaxID=57060 RepID=A0A8J6EQC1_ELECQ|nr:hypothetical protein GDO78_004244 [Eleutherodactylus coqui]